VSPVASRVLHVVQPGGVAAVARLSPADKGGAATARGEHRCATVAPQSTLDQRRLFAPRERFHRARNQRMCRGIRAFSVSRGRIRIPVAVSTERQQMHRNGWQPGPITDQSRESGQTKVVARPDTGRCQDRLAAVGRSSNGRANRVRERVRRSLRARGGRSVNYARRQQYRRLSYAGKAALAKRRRRAARARGRERESAGARRAAAPHRRRAGPLRSPLAFARSS
jgi:hypothetical protein